MYLRVLQVGCLTQFSLGQNQGVSQAAPHSGGSGEESISFIFFGF